MLGRKKPPVFEGAGQLRFGGFDGPVRYAIEGDPAKLRAGHLRLRAALTTTADVAAEAFRAGEGLLTLDNDVQFRVTMLAHSAGGDEVFVELRG